ncbi:MAG: hypothetical protein WC390_10220 [Sulfurimonas sp.]|jgi:hypothetical protein
MKQCRIPKREYKFCTDIGHYITFDQVEKYHSADEIDNFTKWMTGQTGSCVEENGEMVMVIFTDDYERWLRQGKQTEQGADWD